VSDALDAVRDLVAAERLGAVGTVVAGPDLGARVIIDAGGGILAGALPADILEDVVADAAELMAHEQSKTLAYGESEVFIETIAPQPHLLIFGAGHIAQPLSRIARELGFRVTVADARQAWATAERFPNVDRLIVGWPDVVFEQVPLDPRTYVVLLSHDARFEDPVCAAVRNAPVRYIGALGSRRTAAARVERLTAAGWNESEIARIHAPVGIDIGAEEPAEVALSILGEMTLVRYGAGTGLSLRGQAGRIHPQRGSDGTPE
jgi:xanthine dehydrogenase accessory factor